MSADVANAASTNRGVKPLWTTSTKGAVNHLTDPIKWGAACRFCFRIRL